MDLRLVFIFVIAISIVLVILFHRLFKKNTSKPITQSKNKGSKSQKEPNALIAEQDPILSIEKGSKSQKKPDTLIAKLEKLTKENDIYKEIDGSKSQKEPNTLIAKQDPILSKGKEKLTKENDIYKEIDERNLRMMDIINDEVVYTTICSTLYDNIEQTEIEFQKLQNLSNVKNPANDFQWRWENLLPKNLNSDELKKIGFIYVKASYFEGTEIMMSADYIYGQVSSNNDKDKFWQFVWDDNVSIIILLNELENDEYWSIDKNLHASEEYINISIKDRTNYPGYDQITLTLSENFELRDVKLMNFTKWPVNALPENHLLFVDFIESVNNFKKSSPSGPVVIESKSEDQTGTCLVIANLLELAARTKFLNKCVFDCVYSFKMENKNLFKTLNEYKFIYSCVKEGKYFYYSESKSLAPKKTTTQKKNNYKIFSSVKTCLNFDDIPNDDDDYYKPSQSKKEIYKIIDSKHVKGGYILMSDFLYEKDHIINHMIFLIQHDIQYIIMLSNDNKYSFLWPRKCKELKISSFTIKKISKKTLYLNKRDNDTHKYAIIYRELSIKDTFKPESIHIIKNICLDYEFWPKNNESVNLHEILLLLEHMKKIKYDNQIHKLLVESTDGGKNSNIFIAVLLMLDELQLDQISSMKEINMQLASKRSLEANFKAFDQKTLEQYLKLCFEKYFSEKMEKAN